MSTPQYKHIHIALQKLCDNLDTHRAWYGEVRKTFGELIHMKESGGGRSERYVSTCYHLWYLLTGDSRRTDVATELTSIFEHSSLFDAIRQKTRGR